MALYWPRQKVALDIVNEGRHTPPAECDDSWQVVRLTPEQIADYPSYRRVMSRIADLLARGDRDDAPDPYPPLAAGLDTLPQSA